MCLACFYAQYANVKLWYCIKKEACFFFFTLLEVHEM